MFDYSMNSFQRSTFIRSYDVDAEEKEIMVKYADDKSSCLPYSVDEEKRILYRMRRQVLDAGKFYEKLKNSFNKYDLKVKAYMILSTIGLGMTIGLAYYSFLAALLFNLITLPTHRRNYRKYKEYRATLKGFRNTLDDYEKSLEFVENSEAFSNMKVMKPHVIDKCSDHVKFIISQGIIDDKFDEFKQMGGDVPYVNFHLVNDHESLTNPEHKAMSIADEQEALALGFEDVSGREVPFINENTIGDMSYKELSDLYKLTSKENKGRVLVKLKEFRSNSLGR